MSNIINEISALNDAVLHLNDIPDINTLTSKYVNINSMSKLPSSKGVLQLNIKGLINKQHKLNELIANLETCNVKLHVICLCETWLTKDTIHLLNFPNFNIVNETRQFKKGGGVSILVNKMESFYKLSNLSLMNDDIECISLDLSDKTVISSNY